MYFYFSLFGQIKFRPCGTVPSQFKYLCNIAIFCRNFLAYFSSKDNKAKNSPKPTLHECTSVLTSNVISGMSMKQKLRFCGRYVDWLVTWMNVLYYLDNVIVLR